MDEDNDVAVVVVVDDFGIRFAIVSFTRSLSEVDASAIEERMESVAFVTDVRISLDALAAAPFALFDIFCAVSEARRNVFSFARMDIWDALVDADDARDENRLDICNVVFPDSVAVTVVDGDAAAAAVFVTAPTDDDVDGDDTEHDGDAAGCGGASLWSWDANDLLLQQESKNCTCWRTLANGANCRLKHCAMNLHWRDMLLFQL